MFRNVTQDINEYYANQGLVFRSDISAVIATAATGTYFLGFTTGAQRVRLLARSYSSSESPLTVELFEATWSAGSAARTLNSNLAISNIVNPATMFSGVTPGTLGSVITGITLRSATGTGSAQLQIAADESPLIFKANTSYVIRYTNGGGPNASIGTVFALRAMQPEE